MSAVDATGNESARSHRGRGHRRTAPRRSGPVDAGFESGTDGARLDPGLWTLFGAPPAAEYDTARAKNGTLSGLDTGPDHRAYAGVIETKTGA